MSQNQYSVAAHFAGKEPATRKISDRLLKMIGQRRVAASEFSPAFPGREIATKNCASRSDD